MFLINTFTGMEFFGTFIPWDLPKISFDSELPGGGGKGMSCPSPLRAGQGGGG